MAISLNETTMHPNCLKSGIVPLDPTKPLSNEFTFDTNVIYSDMRESFLNNKCLNLNEEVMRELFKHDFNREGSKDELNLTFDKVINIIPNLYSNPLSVGRLLTKIPWLYIDKGLYIQGIKLR